MNIYSGPEEKEFVFELLLQVATKWVAIGILLDISYDRLQLFEAQHDDMEKRVLKLVEAWIENRIGSVPTWRRLAEVIACKAGGDHYALAKKVANDHPLTGKEQGL